MSDGTAPAPAGVQALRIRREERGLSLDRAARATRIPVAHLRAIEEGRFHDLPVGPYRAGQVKAYFELLGLQPDPAILEALRPRAGDAPPRDDLALWAVRIVAGAICAVLAALLVWQLAGRGSTAGGASDATAPDAPDQVVGLTALRNTHLEVIVDGDVALDREVPGGEHIQVAGHRRVEVQLDASDAARVEYNGSLVVPQGRQDTPRRLVFIDDLDPGS